MATDSPDSKLDVAPGHAPMPPSGKENPRAPAKQKPAAAPDAKAEVKSGGKTSAAKSAAAPSGETRGETGDKTAAASAADKKAAKLDAKKRSSALEQMEELDKVGALTLMTLAPAWLISLLVHMVILLLFGLLAMPV